jgi:hypothetical protein
MAMYNDNNAEVNEKIRKHFSIFVKKFSHSLEGKGRAFFSKETEIIEKILFNERREAEGVTIADCNNE